MSKRALGKGLDALIQDTQRESDDWRLIPIDEIDPSSDQPRRKFDDTRLEELASSIRNHGLIQPIVVERKANRYAIVAGERRYRAAKIAGLTELPAKIAEYGERKRLIVSLVENLQREDLDPVEEAEAFRLLMEQSDLNQQDIADQIGKNRSTVANSLRLLNLPENIQNALRDGKITAGHARALLSLVNEEARVSLFKRIVADSMSVREAERIAAESSGSAKIKPRSTKRAERASPEIKEIEQRFIEHLGTKVAFRGDLNSGTVEISYFSKADLERLYELILSEES